MIFRTSDTSNKCNRHLKLMAWKTDFLSGFQVKMHQHLNTGLYSQIFRSVWPSEYRIQNFFWCPVFRYLLLNIILSNVLDLSSFPFLEFYQHRLLNKLLYFKPDKTTKLKKWVQCLFLLVSCLRLVQTSHKKDECATSSFIGNL